MLHGTLDPKLTAGFVRSVMLNYRPSSAKADKTAFIAYSMSLYWRIFAIVTIGRSVKQYNSDAGIFDLFVCEYCFLYWFHHLEHIHHWSSCYCVRAIDLYEPWLFWGIFCQRFRLFSTFGSRQTGVCPVARLLLHTTAQKNSDTHPCLEWDSNPWCQCLSDEGRHL
jgi:hypothetical protein